MKESNIYASNNNEHFIMAEKQRRDLPLADNVVVVLDREETPAMVT